MSLYPIRVYKVTLRFNAQMSLPFFHQPLVSSFLRTLLAIPEEVQNRIQIHTPESGVCQYQNGQDYSFYLFTLNLPTHWLEHLFSQLINLPHSAHSAHCQGALSTNWQLVSMQDGLTQAHINHPLDAATLDHTAILEEAEQWQHYAQSNPTITLKYLSPVRLIKSKKQGFYQTGGELTGELVLSRCFDAYASLCQLLGLNRPKREDLPNNTITTNLFWVDCSYTNKSGKQKHLGGLIGEVTLDCQQLNYEHWVYLVLGQYLGMGQNRNFGMGRFKLVGNEGQSSLQQISRPATLLQTCISYQNLESAWQHEYEKLNKQLKQHYYPTQLEELYQSIHSGLYKTGLLTPRLLQKPGQKERLLLLPSFIDKVAHKVISQWLAVSLDKLYRNNSYGYRKGYSRINAKYRIQHLLRQGYTTVLDADIKQFFASICTEQVIDKLRALYGQDPLFQLVETLLCAEVDPSHELSPSVSPSGLNLGSALSPILANFMLDEFDDLIANNDYQLVRYADDFLILCKTQKEAEQAKSKVETILTSRGLALNAQKTQITHIKQGFRFLGYYFINDLVIPVKPESATNAPTLASTPVSDQALFFDNAPQTVCITGDIAVLACQGKRLKISQQKNDVKRIPLAHIDNIILFGNHHITTPALKRLMKQQVNIYFADSFGNFIGQANGTQTQHQKHLIQASVFNQSERCLDYSKQLITAKIANQIEVLRQRKLDVTPLKTTLNKLRQAKHLNQVLGFEGSASKHYFRQIANSLPANFEFKQRQKQQPSDPINSLLSYGYSMLYAHVDSLLRTQGLCPIFAGLHQTRGQHSTLASDLMEPFRFIVERTMLSTIKLGQIKSTDFIQQGKFCKIKDEARKRWSQYLLHAFQSPKFKQQYSVLDAIQCQNKYLIDWLNGETEHFTPWRLA